MLVKCNNNHFLEVIRVVSLPISMIKVRRLVVSLMNWASSSIKFNVHPTITQKKSYLPIVYFSIKNPKIPFFFFFFFAPLAFELLCLIPAA